MGRDDGAFFLPAPDQGGGGAASGLDSIFAWVVLAFFGSGPAVPPPEGANPGSAIVTPRAYGTIDPPNTLRF